MGGDGDGDEEATVNIHCSNGSKLRVDVKLNSTVESFKTILAQKCDIPPHQQRLIYKGRILKDDQTLHTYGLEADHTVHLVRGFATTAGAPSTNSVDSNQGGPLGGSGFESSLLSELGLSRSGTAPQMEEQMQRQLTQNPNIMRDILNMPMVQNMMNNPQTIRSLIMNNPQMREIMDRNPELAHILNDPSTLHQTMEAARNPELMREMMRNTDRAMSNIESSPEGFNMLRRMYENVQEPFLNASMAGENRSDSPSDPFAALLGAQGGGPGRENMINSTTAGPESTNSPAPNTNPLPNPWVSAGTGGIQTNLNTWSGTTGDARPTSPSGLGGLGLPDFETMLGSTPDLASFNQLMQNPAISQMMRSLLSSPQYTNQILRLNPQLRSMFDSNPQLRDMMQNPEFIRQLTSPETLQQFLTFNQTLSSQLGRHPTSQEQGRNVPGTAGSVDNLGLDMLMNMFGGLGTGGVPNASNSPQVPPEELYATQLTQLREMGFFDTQENIRALIATAGNVHAAVERLLGNPGQ